MQEINVPFCGVNTFVRYEENGTGLPIVLLHGFTGDSRDWVNFFRKVPIDRPWVAIDLLGHGQTDAPETALRYQMEHQIADISAVIDHLHLRSFILLGYSMGGRTALAYAVQHAHHVASLVLESASPGLSTEDERNQRRASDELLAKRILEVGTDQFSEEWANIALFSSQNGLSKEDKALSQAVRKSQRAVGLAGSLRGMGSGSQPSLWTALSQLPMPVLLISGEQDHKFTQIAAAMQQAIPHATRVIVEGAGHNVHLESPNAFWKEVEYFMRAISR